MPGNLSGPVLLIHSVHPKLFCVRPKYLNSEIGSLYRYLSWLHGYVSSSKIPSFLENSTNERSSQYAGILSVVFEDWRCAQTHGSAASTQGLFVTVTYCGKPNLQLKADLTWLKSKRWPQPVDIRSQFITFFGVVINLAQWNA